MLSVLLGKAARGFHVAVVDGSATYRAGTVTTGGRPGVPMMEVGAECSPAQVLVDLGRAYRRRETAPWVPLLSVFVVYFAAIAALSVKASALGVAGTVAASLVSLAGCYALARRLDRIAGAAYLVYELDDEATGHFERLQRGLERLAASNRVWHVASEGRAVDPNQRYGAKLFLRRYRIRPSLSTPPRVEANIRVPTIYSEKRKFYFFPDRVLVYDSTGVRAVPYSLLDIRAGQSLCIEDEDVPPDARVVDSTWLHVLADGSPDRRFSNNRRYPIALYGDLEFAAPGSVRELFQCSLPEALAGFVAAVDAMAWGEEEDEAPGPDEEPEAADPDPQTGEGHRSVDDDALYEDALKVVVSEGVASLELLAERFRIDFSRAAMLLDTMERDGFVGPPVAGSPRLVNRSARRYVEAAYGEGGTNSAREGRSQSGPSGGRARGGGSAGARRHRRSGPRRPPHEVLGVGEHASADEVAAAYRQLAQMYHPDKVASLAPEFHELADRRMKEINAAYRAMCSGR